MDHFDVERGVATRDAVVARGRLRSRPAGLRVCLLSYRSHPHCGGQGVYVRYLSRALTEAGHEVDVVSGPPYPDLDQRVRLVRLPSLDMFGTGKRWTALGWRQARSITNLIEWLGVVSGGFPEPYTFGRRASAYLAAAKGRYDVVHDNQSLCYGLLEVQEAGIPLVATIHHPITIDLEIQLSVARNAAERAFVRRWHSFLRMQKRVVPRLRRVIAVSRAGRTAITREFGVPEERIEVVPNGVDAAAFAPRIGCRRLPNRLMATASADAPLKGLEFLLRAFASLRRARPDLELVVVGRPHRGGRTARLIRELGLDDALRFEGGIGSERLAELYAETAVAVVPSIYEGFGLPAVEAMAAGVPVVATTGGALPEVVGEAGILVPPGDADAIAAATARLLDRPDERRRLGAAGRARVREEFSWRRAAERTAAIYGEAMSHADRRS